MSRPRGGKRPARAGPCVAFYCLVASLYAANALARADHEVK